MKVIIFCCFALFICSASTCKGVGDVVYSIKINNNSVEKIYFFDSDLYPDTSLPNSQPYFHIAGPSNYGYIDSYLKWEKVFENLQQDTLSIFILNYDTVNTYDWNTIKNDYKILKRYDLSLQDLQNSNWTITYP